MRFRAPILALFLVASALVLPAAAHAAIPFFGPIIPPQTVTGIQGSQVCAASLGMLIVVINNIISLLITLAIVFVAPLMIAYAGFLYVWNPVDPGGIGKAKDILQNTVVGIVVALAGWMIVDAIMAVLYNPSEVGKTWSQLLTADSSQLCVALAGGLNQATLQDTVGLGTGALNTVPTGTLVGSACDPAAVQAAASAGGYTLSNTEANIFACIAKPESSCGAKNLNYRWGKGSSAAGAFQVLLQDNGTCYENKACTDALGLPSGSRLNCPSGFRGGNPIPGSPIADQCARAAANLNCSASAAACLLRRNNGNFSPWQADVNNAVQTGCINRGVSGT